MAVFAAMDLGSNSVRLLIAEFQHGCFQTIYTGLRTTRLGEGLSKNNIISDAAQERTVQAMQDFLSVLRAYRGITLGAVATSAVREAKNGQKFLRALEEDTGVAVQVIGGEEEARLSYQGAVSALDGGKNPMVVDIGGGSTEVIYQGTKGLEAFSRPVGAVRCTEQVFTPQEVLEVLEPVLSKARSVTVDRLVGVGGTITTLAAVKQQLRAYDPRLIQGYNLSLDDVSRLLFKLAGMSLAQRKNLSGLQPERADIIVAGNLILWVIMRYLQQERITVSEADLLHGIILDLAGSSV